MGAIARQGPHQVAQKSTRTGLSDFSTSWSKFASVTSTIPLPAMFSFSYVVTSRFRRTLHRKALPHLAIWMSASPSGGQPFIVTLQLDAREREKSQGSRQSRNGKT